MGNSLGPYITGLLGFRVRVLGRRVLGVEL